jgi:hypothetical protein
MNPKIQNAGGLQGSSCKKRGNPFTANQEQVSRGGSYFPQKKVETPNKIQKTSHSNFSRMRNKGFSEITCNKKEMLNM